MSAEWDFGTIAVRHGTPARVLLSFVFASGQPRSDLAGKLGYFRAYRTAEGLAQDLLFPEVRLDPGDADHTRQLVLSAAQCSQAQTDYYAEIEFRDDQGALVENGGWYGALGIRGR